MCLVRRELFADVRVSRWFLEEIGIIFNWLDSANAGREPNIWKSKKILCDSTRRMHRWRWKWLVENLCKNYEVMGRAARATRVVEMHDTLQSGEACSHLSMERLSVYFREQLEKRRGRKCVYTSLSFRSERNDRLRDPGQCYLPLFAQIFSLS
mgnify:CR=1 FL=1